MQDYNTNSEITKLKSIVFKLHNARLQFYEKPHFSCFFFSFKLHNARLQFKYAIYISSTNPSLNCIMQDYNPIYFAALKNGP